MDINQLTTILKEHLKYLKAEGESKADLSKANLSGVNLSKANLSWANLSRANLSWANLRDADLKGVNLSKANLSKANLSRANLSWANLRDADLSKADLSEANLSEANLRDADLSKADLSEANLNKADLSGSKGLIDPIEWMEQNLERINEGYIAYKSFASNFKSPNYWEIKNGSELTEVVNPLRTLDCACGINVATETWIDLPKTGVWKVLIKWEWLPSVVIPYNTNGKFRCGRVLLLKGE